MSSPLKEAGLIPGKWEIARAPGFDLRLAPRANLIRSDQKTVWGINATATHTELTRLYVDHAKGILGETYLPEAILTYTSDGRIRPAMAYLCPHMDPRPADAVYVERIAAPARRVESFPEARKPAYTLWIDFGPFGIKSSCALAVPG